MTAITYPSRVIVSLYLKALAGIQLRRKTFCTEAQALLDHDATVEYKRANPRARKATLEKVRKTEWYARELERRSPQALEQLARYEKAEERLKERLDKFAATLTPLAGNEEVVASWHYSGAYSSQGYGAEKYFNVRRGLDVEALRRAGVEAQLQHSDSVTALVADKEVDGAIVKAIVRAGLPLRETVKYCWKHGCQPRVFWPFLPYEYESENGLDYFGGDTLTKKES